MPDDTLPDTALVDLQKRIVELENQLTTLRGVDLQKRIAELENQLTTLRRKLEPDALAKALDSSYLSTNNLRAFLQILSLIMTVFVAGAVYFGYIGLTNIFSIREEAEKVKAIRQSADEALQKTNSVGMDIQKQLETIRTALEEARKTVSTGKEDVQIQVTNIRKDLQVTMENLRKQNDQEGRELRTRLEARFSETEKQIRSINKSVQDISQIFNRVAVENEQTLNPRERQILFLLARDIDPENPVFNFNAANLAANFGRYDEALRYLEFVLKSKDLPPNVLDRAKALQAECIKLKANPPEVRANIPPGVKIGDYSVIGLHVNTLETLRRMGYISLEQAQKIFDDAK